MRPAPRWSPDDGSSPSPRLCASTSPPASDRYSQPSAVHLEVLGRRHVKLTRQQIRRNLIAVSAVRGHGTLSPGTWHGHPRLVHQPPRLRAAHVNPFILEWFGPATTTITVTRCRGHRVDTGSSGHLLGIDRPLGMSRQVRLTPPATDVEHLAQDRNRPTVLRLGHQGRPPFHPLAQLPRAFLNMSRSIRSRLWSSRYRCHASWTGDTRPFPGKAALCCASTSRFQRPSVWGLISRWRAVSDTPSPYSGTSRTASRVNSLP